MTLNQVTFYNTPPHRCNYLPDQQAITLFVDPDLPKSTGVYTQLSRYGFRRSGVDLYRPNCSACRACIPVRVPVNEFLPNRNQRRNWRSNQDLAICAKRPRFTSEYFALYRRYLSVRHPGGGMDNPSESGFMAFLTADWAETLFFEFRLGRRLLGVAVTDRLGDGLSSVYTFFDPDFSRRGLGRFAVLFEIDEAKRQGMHWLYLGYAIKQCAKMSYKDEYRPLERYQRGQWQRAVE